MHIWSNIRIHHKENRYKKQRHREKDEKKNWSQVIFGNCSAKRDACIINKAVEGALYTLMSTIYFTAICFASISIGALCIKPTQSISLHFFCYSFVSVLFCLRVVLRLFAFFILTLSACSRVSCHCAWFWHRCSGLSILFVWFTIIQWIETISRETIHCWKCSRKKQMKLFTRESNAYFKTLSQAMLISQPRWNC